MATSHLWQPYILQVCMKQKWILKFSISIPHPLLEFGLLRKILMATISPLNHRACVIDFRCEDNIRLEEVRPSCIQNLSNLTKKQSRHPLRHVA
jgi:hypothetical protein